MLSMQQISTSEEHYRFMLSMQLISTDEHRPMLSLKLIFTDQEH